MNLRDALRRAEERLARADIADAKTDAWLLLQHVTGITRAEYFMSPETELACGKEKAFFRLVEERATHRPLQHITGTQDFMGFTFRVNEHVLIPRQDTEILVEEAIKILSAEFSQEEKSRRESFPMGAPADKINYGILDLCTGSGCIAVSLAVWARKNAWPVEITATDISMEALSVAKANAETILTEELRRKRFEDRPGVAGRIGEETEAEAASAGTGGETGTGAESAEQFVCFRQGDLFDAVGREKFSMILSNPPYIRTEEIEMLMLEVRDFEPRLALDGAEDGLALYRRIAAEAPAHLEPGGRLLLEIGCDEACAVSELLTENGFCDIGVLKDYAGLDRVVCGRYEPGKTAYSF